MTESINTISRVKPATLFQIYLWPENSTPLRPWLYSFRVNFPQRCTSTKPDRIGMVNKGPSNKKIQPDLTSRFRQNSRRSKVQWFKKRPGFEKKILTQPGRFDFQDISGNPLNYGFHYFYWHDRNATKSTAKEGSQSKNFKQTGHRFSHLFCCFHSQLRQVFEGKIPQSRPNGQLNGWIKMKYYKFGQFCSVSTIFFFWHLHDHCSVTKVVDK